MYEGDWFMTNRHSTEQPDHHANSQRIMASRIALVGFLSIGAFLIIAGNRATLLGSWPLIVILAACPLMHFFMHSRHPMHDTTMQHTQRDDILQGKSEFRKWIMSQHMDFGGLWLSILRYSSSSLLASQSHKAQEIGGHLVLFRHLFLRYLPRCTDSRLRYTYFRVGYRVVTLH